jgi:hypothetical protein
MFRDYQVQIDAQFIPQQQGQLLRSLLSRILESFSKSRVTTYSRCFDPLFEKGGPKDHFAIYLLV